MTYNGPRNVELGLVKKLLHPGWSRQGEQRDHLPREENMVHLSGEKAAAAGSRARRQQI